MGNSALNGHKALLVSVHSPHRVRLKLNAERGRTDGLPADPYDEDLRDTIGTDSAAELSETDESVAAGLLQLDRVYSYKPDNRAETDDFIELAIAAGLKPDLTLEFNLKRPTPNFYLGKGQVEQVKQLAAEQQAELVAINAPLSSVHQRNWEQELKLPVLNRHDLIFAIFEANAHTAEGKLQVELARLKYELPRIVRSYEKLDPLAGGIGTIGPGEQLTERIKRVHRKRILEIEARLQKLRSQRALRRKLREESGLFTVSLVGYTNVGKSTLLNRLTGSGALVADQYFATLDPTVRSLFLPSGGKLLLTDTVGFVSDLPDELVTSFRATLDEMAGSHLLLHLADASHQQVELQIRAVRTIIADIGLGATPECLIFNKSDRVSPEEREKLRARWPEALFASAATGLGMDGLLSALAALNESFIQERADCWPAPALSEP